MTRWLTTAEVASRLGIGTDLVARYCTAGRLRAEKSSAGWLIEPDSVAGFEAQRRGPGRPPSVDQERALAAARTSLLRHLGDAVSLLTYCAQDAVAADMPYLGIRLGDMQAQLTEIADATTRVSR